MNRIRIGIGIKKKKLRIEEKTIKIIPAVACLVSLLITGCGAKNKINTSTIFAMDTVMQLEIQGDEELLREAEDHIRNIENELSVTNSDSRRTQAFPNGYLGAGRTDKYSTHVLV